MGLADEVKIGFNNYMKELTKKSGQVELPVSEPICDTCKQPINNAWDTFEKFSYKTQTGKIKEVWCCMDCQLNNLYKNDEAC